MRKQHRKFRLDADFDDNDTYLDDAYADNAMVTRARVRKGGGEAAPDRRGRLTEAERDRLALLREEDLSAAHAPTVGDRWSTWERAEHGPAPRPDWVITELVAEDTELGVLKTGKEADVHLISREVPGTGRAILLAAKRYRSSDHRQFHRDAQYLEGRRVRRSRENRAMAGRTSFGRNLIAEQWAVAEFAALGHLWSAGLPVPVSRSAGRHRNPAGVLRRRRRHRRAAPRRHPPGVRRAGLGVAVAAARSGSAGRTGVHAR